MRYVLIFIFTFFYAHALTLSLNFAKQNGSEYATIHLKNNEPILCESENLPLNMKRYLCLFNAELQNKIENKITPFADIEFITKQEKFYILITPKQYSILINSDAKLYESKTTPLLNKQAAKHWSIIIYNKKPFPSKNDYGGINFPISYEKMQYPMVGALDLNDKPIDYAKTKDINLYLDIKKYYKNKHYNFVIDAAKELVTKYPKSIFISDTLLYRFKSIDALLNQDDQSEFDRSDLASEAKKWLKIFPADKNTPEVLSLITKSYLKMGFNSDANYFLDILVSEYPDDPFTQMALINYADHINTGKSKNKAVKIYESVLYNSKDLDVASEAAIRLAKHSLQKGKKQKAKKYLDKVLKANENFIFKDEKQAYKLASHLFDKGLYKNAATIINILLKNAKKGDTNYENMLKDAGIWNEKAKNINKSYEFLKRYQQEFKYGDYKELVAQTLDRLFFELNETNETKLLNYYDKLIAKYQNDIGKKALEKKAELLLKQQKYFKVLELSIKHPKDNNNSILKHSYKTAALKAMEYFLKRDKCKEIMILADDYPHELLSIKNEPKLFSCFMRTNRYKKAKTLCEKKIKDENLVIKLAWLLRLQKVFYKQADYEKTIKIAKDIQALGEFLQNPDINKALYEKFFALYELNRYEIALNTAKQIEKHFKNEFKNIEVYEKVIKMAKKLENDLVIQNYANKIMSLQKKANSFVLSPNLEYEYISSLQKTKKYELAKQIALSVLQRDLNKSQRGRALYVVAEAFMKQKDKKNAKIFFEKCVTFDENSTWKDICKDNLALFSSNDDLNQSKDLNKTNASKN